MSAEDKAKIFFSSFLVTLPILLVCLVAAILALVQSQRMRGALPWALIGFGLAALHCFTVPFGTVMLQDWLRRSASPLEQMKWMFGAVAFANSTLLAAAFIFLLVAAISGRVPRSSPPPMPPF